MPRIDYASDEATAALLSGPLSDFPKLNTFRMFAHAPDAARMWLLLARALQRDLVLQPKLRELAILEIARRTSCTYMWVQHERIARASGMDSDDIAAIGVGAEPAGCGEEGALVRSAAAEAVDEGRIRAGTFDKLDARLGHRAAIELLIVVAHYVAGAIFLRSTEVDLEG